MDVLDSVRRAVRHYPGGLDAVAARLGKSPSTLEKELRGAPQYKLGAEDAAEIAAMCSDLRTPHCLDYPTRLAEHVGATLLPLPHGLETDSITAKAVAGLMRELADVVGSVAAAEADGEISTNELKHIQRQWAELVGSGQALMLALEAKHAKTMEKFGDRAGGAA